MPEYPTAATVECDGECGFKMDIRILANSGWINGMCELAGKLHDKCRPNCPRKALTLHVNAGGLLKACQATEPAI